MGGFLIGSANIGEDAGASTGDALPLPNAIWKVIDLPWRTILAPIFTSRSRNVVSDQCLTARLENLPDTRALLRMGRTWANARRSSKRRHMRRTLPIIVATAHRRSAMRRCRRTAPNCACERIWKIFFGSQMRLWVPQSVLSWHRQEPQPAAGQLRARQPLYEAPHTAAIRDGVTPEVCLTMAISVKNSAK